MAEGFRVITGHRIEIKDFFSSIHLALTVQNILCLIIKISTELFCDGYFASTAEKAIKELETRLRELFRELKPCAGIPAKIRDVVGALLGDNGIYHFCDISTVSGKDYR